MFLDLRIEHAHSLKDRRQVVRSLKEKLGHGFNISIAEMDEALTWQSATLGIAAISGSRDYLSGLMGQVESAAVRIGQVWVRRWQSAGSSSKARRKNKTIACGLSFQAHV